MPRTLGVLVHVPPLGWSIKKHKLQQITMKIIITGTPGTGKSGISDLLGLALDCKVIHVNDLIKKEKLHFGKDNGEYTADFKKLKKRLGGELTKNKGIIIESHLLSDLKLPADLVIVLRCSPGELEKRLLKRKYRREKIKENAMSEILDYCYINALENYGKGKVMQIETTKNVGAKEIIAEIAKFERTKITREFRWLSKLSQKELVGYS